VIRSAHATVNSTISGGFGIFENQKADDPEVMAAELVGVMDKLGFPKFTLIGHDRGGRVSYRLTLDQPKAVEGRLSISDSTWGIIRALLASKCWTAIVLALFE
jgi:pimeloyl-ACP methyl ester carboxylesterase